jgi:hypothetical protein
LEDLLPGSKIKAILQNKQSIECGMDSSGSEKGPVAGCFELCTEPSGSKTGGQYLKQLAASEDGHYLMEFVAKVGLLFSLHRYFQRKHLPLYSTIRTETQVIIVEF